MLCLLNHFLVSLRKGKKRVSITKPVISFNTNDISSSSNFGRKALKELDTLCQQHFQTSASEVLSATPCSKLIVKPSGQHKQSEKRKLIREAKNVIQDAMNQDSLNTVMSNRLSWRKFDQIRASNAFENSSSLNQTPNRMPNLAPDENTLPIKKRKHGTTLPLQKSIQDELLLKASSWGENEVVNWSALAREYGLTSPNGGQSIKEFLREHNSSCIRRTEKGLFSTAIA